MFQYFSLSKCYLIKTKFAICIDVLSLSLFSLVTLYLYFIESIGLPKESALWLCVKIKK